MKQRTKNINYVSVLIFSIVVSSEVVAQKHNAAESKAPMLQSGIHMSPVRNSGEDVVQKRGAP